MRFSSSIISEIKESGNLVALVSESTPVVKKGADYVALCPFHNEKSPSFFIKESKNYFTCFGCGVHGDIITYVMMSKGLSFGESVEELALKYNIRLEENKGNESKDNSFKVSNTEKVEINKALSLANNFFVKSLISSDEKIRDYLITERGLTLEVIKEFSIGFAPNSWNELGDFLKQNNIDEGIILKAGLCKRSAQGKLFDTFRGRIMFPIVSESVISNAKQSNSNVIAFGGRSIPFLQDSEDSPKYINSNESILYKKHSTLYGLDKAIKKIRESGDVYLVEGYFDVVSLHKIGIENAVASCGTALTKKHLEKIAKTAKNIILLFDADKAGKQAASKAFTFSVGVSANIYVIFLPDGHDPDSLVKAEGENAKNLILNSDRKPLFEVYTESLWEKYSTVYKKNNQDVRDFTAAGKSLAVNELVPVLAKFDHSIYRDELIRKGGYGLNVDYGELKKLVDDVRNNLLSNPVTGIEISPVKNNQKDLLPETGLNEENKLSDILIKKIPDLNILNRNILSAIMVLKSSLTKRVLIEPELCQMLDPVVLSFIVQYNEILEDEGGEEEQLKKKIKELLCLFGSSWINFWKHSYEVSKIKDVDFEKIYLDCCQSIKKSRVKERLLDVDLQILNENSDEKKVFLYQEKLSLIKMLDKMLILKSL